MTVPASLAGLPAISLPAGCEPLSGVQRVPAAPHGVLTGAAAQACRSAFSSYPPEETRVRNQERRNLESTHILHPQNSCCSARLTWSGA